MCITPVPGNVGYRRTVAEVAFGANRKNWRRALHMFRSYIVGSEQRDERSWSGSLLNVHSSAGFFALYQA